MSTAMTEQTQIRDYQEIVSHLQGEARRIKKAIVALGTADHRYPDLARELDDINRRLETATYELSVSQSALARAERKAGRAEFEANLTRQRELRAEIIEHARAASDLFGELLALQRVAPKLSERACSAEWIGIAGCPVTMPADREAMERLAQPLAIYEGEWIACRKVLPVELTNDACPRLQPTTPL